MDTATEARKLLANNPTAAQCQEVRAKVHQRINDLNAEALERRALLDRPESPDQAVKLQEERQRGLAEHGILERLLFDLNRAEVKALAVEAVASAEADQKALVEVVEQAEKAKEALDAAVAGAEAVAKRIIENRSAVKNVKVPGAEKVTPSRDIAERLAVLAGGRGLVFKLCGKATLESEAG